MSGHTLCRSHLLLPPELVSTDSAPHNPQCLPSSPSLPLAEASIQEGIVEKEGIDPSGNGSVRVRLEPHSGGPSSIDANVVSLQAKGFSHSDKAALSSTHLPPRLCPRGITFLTSGTCISFVYRCVKEEDWSGAAHWSCVGASSD